MEEYITALPPTLILIYLVVKEALGLKKNGNGDTSYKIGTIHNILTKTDEKGRLLVYGPVDEKLDKMIEGLYEVKVALENNGDILKEALDDNPM